MARKSTSTVVKYEQRLQARLETVLHGMPVAISWARLEDQRIEYLNKRFTELFGYVLGDHATVADWIEKTYVNPEHVKRAAEMWYAHFGNVQSDTVEIPQVEVDVLCKNGNIRTVLLSGVIMPDAGWALASFVDITERKHSEAHIQRLALEDPLTGLPNRRAFTDSLRTCMSRARRQGNSAALLLVDLDGLKQLNDSLGHDGGDLVLQTVAERLKRGTRAGDFVCRLGGDEFGVIVDSISSPRIAEGVAGRIIAEIRKPFAIEDAPVSLDVSIGISIYPSDSDDEQALFKNADLALYRAKNDGRGRWSR